MFVTLIFIAALFLGFWWGARWFENQNLYFPSSNIESYPHEVGLEFAQFTSALKNGIKVNGWFVPIKKSKGTVLICHGNAGNMGHRLDTIKIFHDMGLNVAIFDYPGYGISTGTPNEKNLYDSAEEVFKTIIDKYNVNPQKTVVFGRSLGAAVAVELVTRMDAAGLIIESGFTCTADMGKELFPFLPTKLIVSQNFDSLSKIGNIDIPKLVIHSPDDELIPFKHGKQIFEAAAKPKTFLEISGDHNEGFILSMDVYIKGITSFLSTVIPSKETLLV